MIGFRIGSRLVKIPWAHAIAMPLLLVPLACGHTDVHAVAFRSGLARKNAPVPIYLKGQATPQVVRDIGVVQAVGHGDESSPEAVVLRLAWQGAFMGCDALVRVQIAQGSMRTHAAGVCVALAAPTTQAMPSSAPVGVPDDGSVPNAGP
jgi:hypothetical protein